MTPKSAMVLAAGRGERLRPLTDDRPKPLVDVGGKALIDHALDKLAAAGVARAAVNVSYKGDMIERHLAGRARPAIVISREARRLETGGGIAKALGALGPDPFYVVNGDLLWRDRAVPALARLAAAWDDARWDALLLLVPLAAASGYQGRGDFERAADGRLSRRAADRDAPYVFAGVQLVHPRLFAERPEGAFSINILYDAAIARGRLGGVVHDGDWMHVGDPAGLAAAEKRLASADDG